jgi:hypothetical protein
MRVRENPSLFPKEWIVYREVHETKVLKYVSLPSGEPKPPLDHSGL